MRHSTRALSDKGDCKMHDSQRTDTSFATSVCIPTADRPEALERLLLNLSEQTRPPDHVLVVDASRTDEPEKVCQRLQEQFPPGCLRFERWARGLTGQRRRGIEVLQQPGNVRYVCMLDDDVLLAPDFLEHVVNFLESDEGGPYGGVSGYEMLGCGKPFERLERVYARLKIFDGELRPGRWLYCGEFLQLSRLQPFSGVHDCEFLMGCSMVFRIEVFDQFLPPLALSHYALGEDKHLSLRVGTHYKLGVLGEARIWHYHAPGGRFPRFEMGYRALRNGAIILRDCDPNPKPRRYLAFLGFNLLHLWVSLLFILVKLELRKVPHFLGSLVGWLHCLLVPPKRTRDALGGIWETGHPHPRSGE